MSTDDSAKATAPESEGSTLDLAALLCQFEESFDQTQDERRLAERDRDYYDGAQLTEEELAALKKRGQPPVVANRIGPKIDALLGHEERMRTDPRAFPRTPKHQKEAEAATDAIRFVCDENKFSDIQGEVAENVFIEGIGAVTVGVKKNSRGKYDVTLNLVPWDRYYRDPHSRKRDFSDATYQGVVVWMDEREAQAMFPGKEDVIQSCYAEGVSLGDTFDDRPRVNWSDSKRKRVRVLQHRWRQNGTWMTAVICRGGYLRDAQESPYKDEHGVAQCDIVPTSCYVDRENNRYGVARRHISPQDEINKRRSKALHLLNSKQVIAEDGAVDSVPQARKELAKPDGFVKVAKDHRFEVVTQSELVAGQFQLLQEAKGEIDSSGVNPALEGDARAPSGRAQEMLTAAGLAEMAKAFKALKSWRLAVYRQVWYRIRQFWTEERWIRVTDDENNLRWVALNKPLTFGEKLVQDAEAAGLPPPPLDPNDPTMQQRVGVQNALAELDVDLILEDAPDSITIQSEQFDALVEMKKADPASIPTDVLIEASSLRNKDRLLERIKDGGVPPQVKKQLDEQQQTIEKLTKELEQARTEGADQALEREKIELEREKLRVERYRAETERIQALRPLPPPTPQDNEPPQNEPPQGGFFVGGDQELPQ